MNAVETIGLTRHFGDVKALDGVDLVIPAGSIIGLLGHNGAGKSTTVNILATLLTPSAGAASVCGFDVVKQAARVRENLSLAGQQATLDGLLTGRENLVLLGCLLGLKRKEAKRRSAELLERFGLSDAADRVVSGYSGGMRRRLDLAACLLVPRPVVLLDEPTTGLDPASRLEVWAAIRELVNDGTALLLTTQYLEEADRLADRVVVLADGKVVAEGTPAQMKDRVGGRTVEVVIGDEEHLEQAVTVLREAGYEPVTEARTRAIAVAAERGADDLTSIIRTLTEHDFTIAEAGLKRPTLDDAFLALASGGKAPAQDQSSELEEATTR